VWTSDAPGRGFDRHFPALVPVDLQAGANQLLARVVQRHEDMELSIHACLAGAPGEGAAPAPQPETGTATMRGYRRDGSGRYEEATPPLAWDIEEGHNLAWRPSLPMGNGQAVAWGEHLFCTAEPDELLAIAAADGSVQWRHAHGTGEDDGLRASSTPLVTGERVVAAFGTGTVASYEHDGSLRWRVDTDLRSGGHAMPSPVLCGDLVVWQGVVGQDEAARETIIALRIMDGQEAWRTPLPADGRLISVRNDRGQVMWHRDAVPGAGYGLTAMTLGDRIVVLTHAGVVLDVADGRVLHRAPIVPGCRAAPVIDGDSAYFASVLGQSALRLWRTTDGRVGCRPRWVVQRRIYSGPELALAGNMRWYKGPVVDDGLVYLHRTVRNHWPRHRPRPFGQVDTYAPDNGRWRGATFNCTEKGTNPAAPIAIAGKYLFAIDSGDDVGHGGTRDYGQVAVVLPGPDPLPVWRNRTGKLYAAPEFVGDRLYLRTQQELLCLAVSDEAGAAWQAQQIGDLQVVQMKPRPQPIRTTDVPPEEDNLFASAMPVNDFIPEVTPADWLWLGPLPSGEGDPLAEIGGRSGARPVPGTAVGEHAFAPIPIDRLHVSYRAIVYWNKDKPLQDYTIDVRGLIGKPGPSRTYFFTVVFVPEARCLALTPTVNAGSLRAWMAGVEVPLEEPLRLHAGFYPLLLELSLGRLPPFLRKLTLKAALKPAEDYRAQLAAWRADVRRREPVLRAVLPQLKGVVGGKARMFLDLLEEGDSAPSDDTP